MNTCGVSPVAVKRLYKLRRDMPKSLASLFTDSVRGIADRPHAGFKGRVVAALPDATAARQLPHHLAARAVRLVEVAEAARDARSVDAQVDHRAAAQARDQRARLKRVRVRRPALQGQKVTAERGLPVLLAAKSQLQGRRTHGLGCGRGGVGNRGNARWAQWPHVDRCSAIGAVRARRLARASTGVGTGGAVIRQI